MFAQAFGRLWKIGKLGMAPPPPEPGRHGVALAVILRNEAARVGEWAGFHVAAGARHLYVYDNGCTDATLPILCAAVPAERLTVLPWRQALSEARLGRDIHNQVLAYAHAASNFGAGFAGSGSSTWTSPPGAGTGRRSRRGAGASGPEVRSVLLPWHMFARAGHVRPPEGGGCRDSPRAGGRFDERRARGAAVQVPRRPLPLTARSGCIRWGWTGIGHLERPAGQRVARAERARPEFYSAESSAA